MGGERLGVCEWEVGGMRVRLRCSGRWWSARAGAANEEGRL